MLFGNKFTKEERKLLTDAYVGYKCIEIHEPQHLYWAENGIIVNVFRKDANQWDLFKQAISNQKSIYDVMKTKLSNISEDQWRNILYLFCFAKAHYDYKHSVHIKMPYERYKVIESKLNLMSTCMLISSSITLLNEKYAKVHDGKLLDIKVPSFRDVKNPCDQYTLETPYMKPYNFKLYPMMLAGINSLGDAMHAPIQDRVILRPLRTIDEYAVESVLKWIKERRNTIQEQLSNIRLKPAKRDKYWQNHADYLELFNCYFTRVDYKLNANATRSNFILSRKYGSLTPYEFVSAVALFEWLKLDYEQNPVSQYSNANLISVENALNALEKMYYEIVC